MSQQSRFITRKEIASANELSDDTIRRRERQIGLDKCRDSTCIKPVRFDRATASTALRKKGYRAPD
jgi:hypothetical protein